MTIDNILVTGGCGFIGTAFIAHLVQGEDPPNVRILDNLSEGTPQDLAEVTKFSMATPAECSSLSGVVLVEGDIREPEAARLSAQGVGCIVHLAANTGVAPSVADPRLDMESNVIGTFNMLEAARLSGVSRFIFASSGASAGAVDPPLHEDLPPRPVSPYGASKLAGEGYCSAYSRTFDVGTVSLRFGNVYGPGSKKKSSVVAKFIKRALRGEVCQVFGDGHQTRDFIHVGDIVHAIMLSMDTEVSGECFQIATGREHTVLEIAQILGEELKRHGVPMAIEHQAPRRGDVKRNYADTTKAREVLGWTPQTNLRNGIQETVEYFLERGGGPGAISSSHETQDVG